MVFLCWSACIIEKSPRYVRMVSREIFHCIYTAHLQVRFLGEHYTSRISYVKSGNVTVWFHAIPNVKSKYGCTYHKLGELYGLLEVLISICTESVELFCCFRFRFCKSGRGCFRRRPRVIFFVFIRGHHCN